jgi:hypothetical protein
MNRGVLVLVPFGVAVGSYIAYQLEQDKVERKAFEDAMFAQLVAEEKERERKQKELPAEATQTKSRGFWG